MGSFIKRLVNRYINVVNFITASIIICICLIVLLPAVHLPLDTEIEHHNEDDTTTTHNHNDNNGHQNDNHHHHHHHHHRIPTGEVLICAGFFVFHSIGLLVSGRKMDEQEPLLIGERRMSTVCCSSTRCPSGREIAETLRTGPTGNGAGLGAMNSHEQMLEGAHMIYSTGQEDDCVLLLNQHHQHHTHNTHHDHALPTSNAIMTTSSIGGNYGSMGPDLVRNVIANGMDVGGKHSRIYVEEIKAISPMPYDDDEYLKWPSSIKVGLFAIILALSLVLFDFKIYGLMDALQVFRAASVGALLYIAFFLVLPKSPLGCGSCSKEKA